MPPLPLNKTGRSLRRLSQIPFRMRVQLYSRYPCQWSRLIWNSVKSHIDFVLSHPNGWEGTQQSEMRRAAVLAGLIPDNPSGHSRLSFVTEGEPSLHFSVQNGLPAGAMKVCEQVEVKVTISSCY